MKTSLKNTLVALSVISAIGGSFALAQSNPSVVTTPAPSSTVTPPAARGPGARGPLMERQPKMHEAMRALELARLALDEAEHDKGGYREKAVLSVAQAIKDVQAGIDYADTHPDEFPLPARGAGARGTGRRGGSGTPSTTGSATTPAGTS